MVNEINGQVYLKMYMYGADCGGNNALLSCLGWDSALYATSERVEGHIRTCVRAGLNHAQDSLGYSFGCLEFMHCFLIHV